MLSDDYICRTADTCTELNEGQGMAILVPACLAAMAAARLLAAATYQKMKERGDARQEEVPYALTFIHTQVQ